MPTVIRHRTDLLADQRAYPPFGHRAFTADDPPVRVGVTGTGDDLLLFVWSATDLAREVEAGTRVLGGLGVRTGLRVGNTLPGALATPGALLLGDVNEAIGALDVPLGTVETEAAARAAWELVDRVQCQILVLVPETAETLFRAAPAVPRPWLDGIVWLRQPGAGASPLAPAGFGRWQRTWLAVPEVTSFAAGSCDRGLLHVDAGVSAEIVDGQLVLVPRGSAVAPGPFISGIAARSVRCACGAGDEALEF
jgi:hypothetical protein